MSRDNIKPVVAAAVDRINATIIVEGETPEKLRERIAGRVADMGKPTFVMAPPTGPQFAKVFQTERGQIVAMLHQDSNQNPAILLWFDAGIDGLALTHLELGFTDDEEGESKARTAFDNLDQAGVERVVFQNIDNLREHFEVAP